MKKLTKHLEDMTAAELAEATREFDAAFVLSKARPLTRAERKEERILRPGRPRIGQGAQKVSISMESSILRATDALARRRGVKRSELISSFVVAGLKRVG